jgi:hypothetical protein
VDLVAKSDERIASSSIQPGSQKAIYEGKLDFDGIN